MAKRHSYEWVKQQFEDRGFILVSQEYKGVNEKLEFKCPKHVDKVNEIRFSDFRRGHGCKHCGIEARASLKRAPYSDVLKTFEDKGYKLLDKVYLNSSTPLKYICPKHPDKNLKITYSSIKKGQGCPHCAKVAKPTIEEVKQEFTGRGYTLLSTEYINSTTKLTYICGKHEGKINEISYANFKHLSQGCPHCAGVIRYTLNSVEELFAAEGYELLETEYISNSTKMRYRCPKHPEEDTRISLKEFNRGSRCRYCYLERNRGEGHPSYNPELTESDRERNRYYPEYYEFRRKVFERDAYTCSVCSDSTGGNLVAHHLDGYNWQVGKRTDVNNGVTLCRTCHSDFHENYGYGDNTASQFIEWVTKVTIEKIKEKEGIS